MSINYSMLSLVKSALTVTLTAHWLACAWALQATLNTLWAQSVAAMFTAWLCASASNPPARCSQLRGQGFDSFLALPRLPPAFR